MLATLNVAHLEDRLRGYRLLYQRSFFNARDIECGTLGRPSPRVSSTLPEKLF